MHTVVVCALLGAVGLNEVVRVSSRGRVVDEPQGSVVSKEQEPVLESNAEPPVDGPPQPPPQPPPHPPEGPPQPPPQPPGDDAELEPAVPLEMDRSSQTSPQTSPERADQDSQTEDHAVVPQEMDRTEDGALPPIGEEEPDSYLDRAQRLAVSGFRTLADQFRGDKVATTTSADLLSPRGPPLTGLGRGPRGKGKASKQDTHHCCCYYTGADDRGEHFCGDLELGEGEVETAPVILYNGLHACRTQGAESQCAPGWLEALWSKTVAFPGECISNDLYATDINTKFPFGSEPVRTIEGKWVWSAEVDTCRV